MNRNVPLRADPVKVVAWQRRSRKPLPRVSKRKLAQLVTYWRARRDVESRAGGRCELVTPACETTGTECHHLLPRSAGGDDSLGNLAWACPACHRWVHDHPTVSYERGWLRSRYSSWP